MGLAIYSESGLLKLTQMSPEVIVRKQHQENAGCLRDSKYGLAGNLIFAV